jgi:hypothetical protein
MAAHDFNGIHYFFYYTTSNTVLVESGGLYRSFPATAGSTQIVFSIQVVVSEAANNYVTLSVRPL